MANEIDLKFRSDLNDLAGDLRTASASTEELNKKVVASSNIMATSFAKASQQTAKFDQAVKKSASSFTVLSGEAKKTGDSFKQFDGTTLGKGKKAVDDLSKSFVPLRTQLQLARQAAFQAIEQFGENSPQAISAKKNFADLQEKIDDLQKGVQALNPEAKFTAFAQLGQGIVGGFQAAAGAMAIFGEQGENVQRAILRIQGVIAFSQGINQILGLADSFKNVAAVLGITTAATQANTAAKAANTAATTASTGATVTNTAVVTASATGFNIASVAARAFGVALRFMMGPVGLVVTALGALFGAFKLIEASSFNLSEAIDNMAKSHQRFNDELAKTDAALERETKALEANILVLKARANLLIANANNESEANAIKAKTDKEIFDAEQELIRKSIEANKKKSSELIKENKKLTSEMQVLALQKAASEETLLSGDLFGSDDAGKQKAQQQFTENFKIREEQIKQVKDLEVQIDTQNKQLEANRLQFEADQISNRKEFSKKSVDEVNKLKDALLKAETDLQNALRDLKQKAQQAELQGLTGEARIAKEKEIAQQELQALKDSFLLRLQEQERQRLILQGLGEREVQDRVRQVQFSAEQSKFFQALQNEIDRKATEQTEQLIIAREKAKLALIKDSAAREEREAELIAAERIKQLIAQGVAEADALNIVEDELNKAAIKRAESQIARDEALSVSVINARKRGAESEVEFEQQKELAILNVQLESARKQLALKIALALALGDNSKETTTAINNAKALVNQISEAIEQKGDEMASQQGKFDILAMFFPDNTEEQLNLLKQQLGQFADAVIEFTTASIEADQARNDKRLEQSKALIQSLDDQIRATEASITREQELMAKGVANNVDGEKRRLEALKAQKQKALEEDKRLQAEREKLAKRQAQIEAVQQAAGLLSSSVNIFKKATEVGGPLGVFIAIAAAAAMIAGFLSLKAKVAAATKFEKGGRGGKIQGPSHEQGGVPVYGGRAEAEGGEWFINKKSSTKYDGLLDAINRDNFSHLKAPDLRPLLEGTGVMIPESKIVNDATTINYFNKTDNTVMRVEQLEKLQKQTNKHLIALNTAISSREEVTVLPDGSRIIKTKNSVRRINPK